MIGMIGMIGIYGTSVIALLALAFGAVMSVLYYLKGQKNVNQGKVIVGLKESLETAQRTNNRTVATANGLAENIRRVQIRAKYFVDLLNILSREPFSRRKRESFFEDIRIGGIDAALVAYEQKYGNLLEKASKVPGNYPEIAPKRKRPDTRMLRTQENS